jgi:hypothetical protein
MKTTITLTREDGAEITFSPDSLAQSHSLSFPRGMVLNDAARDPVRSTMKAEAERVAALLNGAPALLAALKEVTEQHDEMLANFPNGFGWGRLISDKARAAIALAEGRTE